MLSRKEGVKLNEFKTHLAERMWHLHSNLYEIKRSAESDEECLERIKMRAMYSELKTICAFLPENEKNLVLKKFNELRGF